MQTDNFIMRILSGNYILVSLMVKGVYVSIEPTKN